MHPMHASMHTAQHVVETGHVTSIVDCAYPRSETADAITHLESGRTRGKIAIAVDTREPR